MFARFIFLISKKYKTNLHKMFVASHASRGVTRMTNGYRGRRWHSRWGPQKTVTSGGQELFFSPAAGAFEAFGSEEMVFGAYIFVLRF